jgi:hypothetical protein
MLDDDFGVLEDGTYVAAFCLRLVQVCKHFLDAVEKKQYGWFWTCPNGGKDCHYRHALPAGYVLKSQMKALLEEEGEKLSIEEEIENQVCCRIYENVEVCFLSDRYVGWVVSVSVEEGRGV